MLTRVACKRSAICGNIADKAFLPFLYNTPTILRGYAVDAGYEARHTARDEPARSTRRSLGVYVPFDRPPRKQDPYDALSFEGSTITPNERKAFDSLFALPHVAKATSEGDAVLKEGPNVNAATSKDSAFKIQGEARDGLAAIIEHATSNVDLDGRRTSTLPDVLKPMAAAARQRRAEGRSNAGLSEYSAANELALSARRETLSVKRAMNAAQTDVEVWNILHERVLNRVAELDLDGLQQEQQQQQQQPTPEPVEQPNTKRRGTKPKSLVTYTHAIKPAGNERTWTIKRDAPKNVNTTRTTEIITSTLPEHLLNTMSVLETSFPLSALPLTIIPTLKRLGPGATALGLTTALYNKHLRLVWKRYRDYGGINSILAEMDREVYELGGGTLNLLGEILNETAEEARGFSGRSLQVLANSDRTRRSIDELQKWYDKVKIRIENVALKAAREKDDERRLRAAEEEYRDEDDREAELEGGEQMRRLAAG